MCFFADDTNLFDCGKFFNPAEKPLKSLKIMLMKSNQKEH